MRHGGQIGIRQTTARGGQCGGGGRDSRRRDRRGLGATRPLQVGAGGRLWLVARRHRLRCLWRSRRCGHALRYIRGLRAGNRLGYGRGLDARRCGFRDPWRLRNLPRRHIGGQGGCGWLGASCLAARRLCHSAPNGRLDQHVVGAPDHHEVFDIIASQENETALTVDVVSIDDTQPRALAALRAVREIQTPGHSPNHPKYNGGESDDRDQPQPRADP